MTKVSKLIVKDLFGIKEFSYDGKDVELVGKKGVGKTSVLDAIRYAFTNKSNRDYIVREGAEQGELILETDTGLTIARKKRDNKADYKSIKSPNMPGLQSEKFLREIFTELQLNPLEFASMSKDEQNRIILDMINFSWDLDWIREQFGEIVPGVNYQQNILCVLNDIQSEKGHYYKQRHDLNSKIKHNNANIKEIIKDLPEQYQVDQWEHADLGKIYKKIEKIRHRNNEIEKARTLIENKDDKARGIEAEYQIEITAIDKAIDKEQEIKNKQIDDLEKQILILKGEIQNLEEKRSLQKQNAEKEKAAKMSQFNAKVIEFGEMAMQEIESISDLQEEAEHTEEMKGYISDYYRMRRFQEENEKFEKEIEDLTNKIEKARTLPGQILQEVKMPIKGLTIKNGMPLINGLPVSNLSSGELFELCVDIVSENKESLNILLLDGIEKLPSEDRNNLYKKLKEKEIQFIATRTDDTPEMTVIEL